MARYIQKFKKQSNYSAMQQTIRRLDKAYKRFFNKCGGFPRYKKRFCTIEYGKYGDGCKVNIPKSLLYLQNVGNISIIVHRGLEHSIKTLSLTCRNNRYFVNLMCETPIYSNDLTKVYNDDDTVICIDFGIKNLITTSNGEFISAPKPLGKKLKELKKLHKKKNYKAINKVYTKITNIRKDFNHKLSRTLVNKYNCLCIEDIKVKDWFTNIRNINRTIADINIGQLISFMVYKAESAGKRIIFVNPKILPKCVVIVVRL